MLFVSNLTSARSFRRPSKRSQARHQYKQWDFLLQATPEPQGDAPGRAAINGQADQFLREAVVAAPYPAADNRAAGNAGPLHFTKSWGNQVSIERIPPWCGPSPALPAQPFGTCLCGQSALGLRGRVRYLRERALTSADPLTTATVRPTPWMAVRPSLYGTPRRTRLRCGSHAALPRGRSARRVTGLRGHCESGSAGAMR